MIVKYYSSAGLSSTEPFPDFCIEELNDKLTFPGDGIFYDLNSFIVSQYDYFQDKYFPDGSYYSQIASRPLWLSNAGIDADFQIDKKTFEKLIAENCNELNNKILLLHDTFSILSSIQNRIIETKSLFCLFFRSLCELNEQHLRLAEDDGLYWMAGYKTSTVYSYLENIIIKIYAIFDLLTKILIEKNAIYEDFHKYPVLKSKGIIYGDRLKYIDERYQDTIFNPKDAVLQIINLRNEIIHNGSLEYQAKVFFEISEKKLVGKYILLIDSTNGSIDCVKNRRRFYSKGTRINQELPNLYLNIINKIFETMKIIFSDNT